MKRILINGAFVGRRMTGLQRYGWEIASRIVSRGEARVIYAAQAPAPDLPADSLAPISYPLYGRSMALWDWRLMLRIQSDELLWSPGNIGPPIRNHVATIHDLSPLRNPEWFSGGFVLKYRTLLPMVARKSPLVITGAETVKDELCERWPFLEGKVHAIHHGVSQGIQESANHPLPEALIEKTQGPYYVALGSIDPRKNLNYLLEAWSEFQSTPRPERLLIVGGSSTAFRQAKLTIPPNCDLLGYVPDEQVAPLLKGARGLISPSLYEGFNLPPLEALSLGTPILLSDIPVHREVFGEWAHFFSLEDRSSLIALLERGEHAIPNQAALSDAFQNRYNWDVAADRIYQALCECAAD